MDRPHDVEHARELGKVALDQMERRGIPLTPRNYAIWYEHACGLHPDLAERLQTLPDDATAADAELDRVYEHFIAAGRQRRAIRDAGLGIQETLARILSWLASAGADTRVYGETLQSLSGVITADSTAPDLTALLQRILDETQAMVETNSVLATRLQSSAEQIVELKRNLEHVRQEAMTDVLTGIANRKLFEERLEQAAAEAASTGQDLCVLLADIDHFKQFNDTWGHQFGDQVLKLVARALVDGLKGQDMAARFGGEEFAILLPRTRFEDALRVAENIRRAVAERKLVKRSTGEAVGRVTLSFGVARYRPGEPLAELIGRADQALYQAKRAGRNQVSAEAAGLAPVAE